MFLIIICLLVLLICLIDFRKGTYLFILFQVIWSPGITIFRLGGSSITMGLAMSSFYVLVFFVKGGTKRICHRGCDRFPFAKPFVVLLFSYILTCFFAVGGFIGELSRAISIIFQELLVIWVMWYVINDEKDYKRLTKGIIILFVAAGGYGIIEYLLKNNPLVLLKSQYVEGGIILYSSTTEALTRGYRIVSFFEHPIGAGMTMALFVLFILSIIVVYNDSLPPVYSILAYVGIGLCTVCVVLTKMRSAIIFLGILLLGIIDFRKRRFWVFLLTAMLFFLIASPIFADNFQIIESLFNRASAKKVGGSSLQMRLEQWEAVLNLLKMSPVFGLGEKFDSVISNIYTQMARGYESIWFVSLTRHGIFGALSNLYLLYYSIISVPRKYKSRPAMILGSAYWIVYTVTTIPSFRLTLYFLLYFFFVKKNSGPKRHLVC